MKYLKHTLIFVFFVDFAIFLSALFAPDLLAPLFPPFNIESVGNAYPQLVGFLFMMFGLTRLYGAVYIQEKGAFVVSIWSWVGELTYIIAGVFYGHFVLSETLAILVLASMMLVWSLLYYRQAFQPTEKK